MAGARAAGILAGLIKGGPAASWPDRLVEDCRQATRVSGVGRAVMGAAGAGGIVAATGGHAQQMEDLQFALGEGPCMDAARTGRPVFCSDLSADGAARWPAFSSGAGMAGVVAAFTFPLQVGVVSIGVLDLYRDRSGPLTTPQVTEAVAFADAAVSVLLHLQDLGHDRDDRAPDGDGGRRHGDDDGLPAWGPAAADWAEVTDRRAVVHQAAGMVSVQLGVDVAEALLRLRAHAFATGCSMVDLATEVVARRVRFDHSEAGTTTGPRHPDPDDSPGEEPQR
jgi:hypothetical protein